MALLQSSKGSNCPRAPGPLEQFCNIRYRHDVAYGIPQSRRIGFGLLWVLELEAVGLPRPYRGDATILIVDRIRV